MKKILILFLFSSCCNLFCQETSAGNPSQTQTQLKVNQLVEKKAEYHRLTKGVQDGYRIKIHLSVDRDAAETVKTKCLTRFTDVPVHLEYQQPNWVVLVGDYKTKLEAFDSLRKIQTEFPSAFIVKAKIEVM